MSIDEILDGIEGLFRFNNKVSIERGYNYVILTQYLEGNPNSIFRNIHRHKVTVFDDNSYSTEDVTDDKYVDIERMSLDFNREVARGQIKEISVDYQLGNDFKLRKVGGYDTDYIKVPVSEYMQNIGIRKRDTTKPLIIKFMVGWGIALMLLIICLIFAYYLYKKVGVVTYAF